LPAADWHGAFGELVDDLNGDKLRGYRLEVANRLFGQAGIPWAAGFLAVCEEDWHAPMEELDFAADPEGARDTINGWVSDRTEGRIPDLLPAGVVTGDTRLVLANAIYFLADWWTRFDEKETYKGDFHRLDGSRVQADLMQLDLAEVEDHRVRARSDGEVTAVRLPYEDDEVSAYVLIPEERDGLPALEARLDSGTFDDLIAGLEAGAYLDEGVVVLPKFEIRWKASLVPALRTLGVTDLFDGLLADLSPMADDGAADGFYVAEVLHEAWVRVDEAGTEAAAATAVIVNDTSAGFSMVADHPFLLVIRDDLTGSVLFVARVTDPTAE